MDQYTQIYEFLKTILENPFLLVKFRKEKSVLPLHATEQGLFQRKNGFVRRLFEFLCLFLEHSEVSMGFIILKMIDHSFCNLNTNL